MPQPVDEANLNQRTSVTNWTKAEPTMNHSWTSSHQATISWTKSEPANIRPHQIHQAEPIRTKAEPYKLWPRKSDPTLNHMNSGQPTEPNLNQLHQSWANAEPGKLRPRTTEPKLNHRNSCHNHLNQMWTQSEPMLNHRTSGYNWRHWLDSYDIFDWQQWI